MQIDKFAVGKFSTHINLKHVVVDCIDPRERRVLEFVVPILHQEKPTQITMMLANTIFGALSGVKKVSYAGISRKVSF